MSRDGTSAAERSLRAIWGEIADLGSASQLLEWDQETQMPAGGEEGRAKVLGTLAGLQHRLLTSSALGDALAACAEQADAGGGAGADAGADDDEDEETGSLLAAQVRVARHAVERSVRVPESLAKAIAEAQSRGTAAWQRARAAADFTAFVPALSELLALKREQAAAIRPDGARYDALLDGFEPGATEAWLAPLFDGLERALVPRLRAIAENGRAVDESAALGAFPRAAQEAFGRRMAAAIGFDFERGRLDASAHPFCVGVGRGDVRLTWRWQEDDFRPALFGILHEAGHGLYEQGLPGGSLARTPVAEAVSLGVHESQSRLWENHVGRSRGFWRWAREPFEGAFPAAAPLDVEALWPALHTVRPSLIRVEADQATYNLHVVIRFDIERRLLSGDLEVADLPAAWDARYREVLGVTPADAAEGVLQDIHWSQGLFGYFPTYTLGTMAAAQLFAAAERELGDLEEAFAAGDFAGLLGWLRREVHVHGGRYEARELIRRATGRELAPDDLLAHLARHAEAVYGVG